MRITSKYAGTCKACGKPFDAGTTIEWTKDAGAKHVDCATAPAATTATPTATDKPKAKRPAGPTKRCWECGCSFSYSECKKNGGDWSDSYCGC